MRDFLIAGNWKMNGSSAANAELVAGIVAGVPAGSGFSLLVCPPFPYLASVAEQVKGSPVKVGAHAFTGEVAPGMLSDIGCDYVIVGHSERRSLYGETSEQVAAKFQAARDHADFVRWRDARRARGGHDGKRYRRAAWRGYGCRGRQGICNGGYCVRAGLGDRDGDDGNA
jgi:hypothetical protein